MGNDMNVEYIIGLDNGVTGSIGIIGPNGSEFEPVPSKMEQSYTKKKQNITRIDGELFSNLLPPTWQSIIAVLERPMVNPRRFKATMSAVRALEATQILLEHSGIPYMFIDSKEWQRELLPSGLQGTAELKKASVDIGCRLFPAWRDAIVKHGDADGLLIAEYARRRGI